MFMMSVIFRTFRLISEKKGDNYDCFYLQVEIWASWCIVGLNQIIDKIIVKTSQNQMKQNISNFEMVHEAELLLANSFWIYV